MAEARGGRKRPAGAALAGLVVFLAACASVPAPGSSSRAEAEVLAAAEAWRAAYDSREPARITALYARDAVFWGTTMSSVAATPEAVAEYFKDAAARPNARVVFAEQHVRVYGDAAFNAGSYVFSDVRDGRRVERPARFSMVYHRRDGVWTLVHHHSSQRP